MVAEDVGADPLANAMVRYQEGDGRAFEEIHRELSPPLLGWLRSLTLDAARADDLLQETFLQMHRVRATYRPPRPVKPWAFGIARNVWLMDRRSTGRRRRRVDTVEELPELPVPPEVADLADRDRLQRALGDVSDDQREALLLHHFWGLSFAEIGGALGVRPGTAKVRAHRGIQKLRSLLGAEASS